MTKNVFRDGQTKPFYVSPVRGMHEGMHGTYRPMLPEDTEFTEVEIAKLDPRKAVQLIAAQIHQHLVSWSEVNDEGKPMQIVLANIRRLPHRLLNRVYRIIAGLDPSDLDPDVEPDDGGKSDAERIIAAASGELVGLKETEADLKN